MYFNGSKVLRFSSPVAKVITDAGWYLGRTVSELVSEWEMELSGDFQMNQFARTALLEFGGLKFALRGRGIDVMLEPFSIDPLLCIGEEDRFREFERLVGLLAPFGNVAHGLVYLGISTDGQVFLVSQNLERIGQNIEDALDRLIQGKRADWIE